MNCKQINNIPFERILQKLGYSPAKEINNELWYISPFREERTASFRVNIQNNTFRDFGNGASGSVVDFWCHLHQCNIKTCISQITNLFSLQEQEYIQKDVIPRAKIEKSRKPLIKVLKVKAISHPKLKAYLTSRKLSERIYSKIKEVHFELAGRHNYAIGLLNDIGGYDLRNSICKRATSKSISTMLNEGSTTLCIFEGMCDYLSYLEDTTHSESPIIREMCEDWNQSFLILNSVEMGEQAIPYIKQFEEVCLFLDNDKAGQNLTAKYLAQFPHVEDCSSSYSEFKDYSDYHIHQMSEFEKVMNWIRKMKF